MRHIQHSPNTPTTGLRECGNDTSKSTGRSGRQKAATRRNMRREERVTVQGPIKKQQPDGMSHRGALGPPAPLKCNSVYPPPALKAPPPPLPWQIDCTDRTEHHCRVNPSMCECHDHPPMEKRKRWAAPLLCWIASGETSLAPPSAERGAASHRVKPPPPFRVLGRAY